MNYNPINPLINVYNTGNIVYIRKSKNRDIKEIQTASPQSSPRKNFTSNKKTKNWIIATRLMRYPGPPVKEVIKPSNPPNKIPTAEPIIGRINMMTKEHKKIIKILARAFSLDTIIQVAKNINKPNNIVATISQIIKKTVSLNCNII